MAAMTCITKTQLLSLKAIERLEAMKESLPVTEAQSLRALLSRIDKRSKVAGFATQTVEYRPSRSAIGMSGHGRLFSSARRGLETLSKRLRGSLCEDIYVDLDFENCQPAILSQLAKLYDKSLTTIQLYAENRNAFLNELMTHRPDWSRDDAKGQIISAIFGGEFTHPWIAMMVSEMVPFVDFLKTTPTWKPVWELVNHRAGNRNGSFMAAVLSTIERQCMLAMTEFLQSTGWSVDVLCYDGVMVRKRLDRSIDDGFLDDISVSVKETTGYFLKVTEKPMLSYLPVVDSVESTAPTEDGVIVPEGTAITDLLAAETMISLLGDSVKKQGSTVYIYNELTGMWDSDSKALFRAAIQLGERLTLRHAEKAVKHHYGSMVKKIEAMIRCVPDKLPATTWIRDNTASSKGKILCSNGICDMATGAMSPFDKNVVFLTSTGRALGPYNETVIKEVRDTVFKDPYSNPDVGYYYSQVLARGLGGHVEDKVFPVILGEPNTGKSTATILMSNAFGGFVSVWNIDNLKLKTGSTTDEAKRLSWIAENVNSRLAISSEARMDGLKLDGNLAKRLSGGGDAVTYRTNFKDEVTVTPQTTYIAMANDLPPFSPVDDALRVRMRFIMSDYTFVPKPLDACSAVERPADPTLKEKVGSPSWMDAFSYIMFEAYAATGGKPPAPDAVSLATDDYVPPPSVSLLDTMTEAGIVVSDSDDDWLTARDVINAIKSIIGATSLSDAKIGREMAKAGYPSKRKKVDGKTITVYSRLKKE